MALVREIPVFLRVNRHGILLQVREFCNLLSKSGNLCVVPVDAFFFIVRRIIFKLGQNLKLCPPSYPINLISLSLSPPSYIIRHFFLGGGGGWGGGGGGWGGGGGGGGGGETLL